MQHTAWVAVFWLVVALSVAGVLLNAWRLDRRAARQGKVLVPVKAGLSRTRFVAVDKAEREAQRRAALLADLERERDERRRGPHGRGYLSPAEAALSFFGLGRGRGR